MWRPGAEPRQRVETRAGGFVPLIYPLTETFKDATRRFGGFASFLVDFVSLRFTVCHTRKTDEKSITFFLSKLLTIQNENEYRL